MADPLEELAKDLFYQNAKDWTQATPWDLLHEDTKQIWRDFAAKRLERTPGDLGK